MHRSPLRLILPGSIDLGYIAIITCVLIVLGNGKLILQKMGLVGSKLIGEQFISHATRGLNALAHLNFTASAVTMLIWGGAGLLIYSALQSFIRTARIWQYEREFSSNDYVHPQAYTRHGYWHRVMLDWLLGYGLLLLLAVGGLLYLFVFLPTSYAYLREFINTPALSEAMYPLMSFATAYLLTAAMYVLLHLVINHHRIIKEATA